MPVYNFNFDLSAPRQIIAAEKLAETTSSIATENFEWRYMTFLFFNSTILYGVNHFLKLYDKSVLTGQGTTEPRDPGRIRQYIIFGQDVAEIENTLDWMKLYNFDNTGKHIVICESECCDEYDAVRTFWYHKITNVVYLTYKEEKVNAYTYFFSGDNCAMSAPAKIDMESCLQNMTNCVFYPEKFSNLYRCPLITSTFPQPPYMIDWNSGRPRGSDGSLLSILAAALNATLKMMTPTLGDGWGALDDQGVWHGSLGDVYYDLANISMTSAALTQNRFLHFQLSYNYDFVIIGWITNPTELESASLKLLHPFNKETHFAVAFTFICVFICSIFISSKLWRRFKKRVGIGSGKKNNVLFYSWMICMGLPAAKLPKKPVLVYIAFLWIWYTFMVRTMYQASLINSLKTNVYVSNVDTVEEMVKNNYKLGGGFALRDYFINYPEVYDNFIGMNFSGLTKVAQRISKGEKFAIAVNLEAVTSLYFTNGEPYHVVAERIVVSPTAIFFKKFSPLANSVNKVLRRMVEAGITEKLYSIYVKAQIEQPKSIGTAAMTLQHFTGCYFILFAGWSVSFLIFLCEMLFGGRNKWHLNS